MAHFAELDEHNIVTNVVVVNNDELLINGAENEARGVDFLAALYGHRRWKQTSYNGNMRGCYAGIGFLYDPQRDIFISAQPFPSWSLNVRAKWEPPIPYPVDGNNYRWDESSQGWAPA